MQNKQRCKWCNLKNEKYIKYHDEEWGILNLNEQYLFSNSSIIWYAFINSSDFVNSESKFCCDDFLILTYKYDIIHKANTKTIIITRNILLNLFIIKTSFFTSFFSMIGIITFILAIVGTKVGNRFGDKYEKKAELVGGVILILLGIKILLEHMGILNF